MGENLRFGNKADSFSTGQPSQNLSFHTKLDLVDVDSIISDAVVVLVKMATLSKEKFLFVVDGPVDAHDQFRRSDILEKPVASE